MQLLIQVTELILSMWMRALQILVTASKSDWKYATWIPATSDVEYEDEEFHPDINCPTENKRSHEINGVWNHLTSWACYQTLTNGRYKNEIIQI